MAMEDGEILDNAPGQPHGPVYDPAYEWPGSDRDQYDSSEATPTAAIPSTRANAPPTCRLLVAHSSILPKHHRLAILDAHPAGVQIGRDLPSDSDTPRIRLKEMEVSKLHATVFWDAARAEWAVVDMGSKHGTFVQSESGSVGLSHVGKEAGDRDKEKGARLSAPRVASIPRTLKHMDTLSVGGTRFLVHIHEVRLPCIECSASARGPDDEILLFGAAETRKRKRAVEAEVPTLVATGIKDAKKALTSLKRDLLSRQGYAAFSNQSSSSTSGQGYVDRSARRRALHPSSAPDTPGVQTPPVFPFAPVPASRAMPVPVAAPPEPPRSAPPAPLEASNVGHRLLRMQGWQPGSALGLPVEEGGASTGMRLVEPLEVNATVGRAGLGMPGRLPEHQQPTVNDWKRRRWEDVQRATR